MMAACTVKREKMDLRLKFKWEGVLAGVVLLLAWGSARAESFPSIVPGSPNVVTDPGFGGQSPDFQAGGSVSPDWTYTPDFLSFGGSYLTLVSQAIPTPGQLNIYDIDLKFGSPPSGQPMLFLVLWDGSVVGSVMGSAGWQDDNFLVTATSPTSELGFVGNEAAWSSLGGLDVSFSGMVDPLPAVVPDMPIGFGMEAATLVGLCWAASHYRRLELRPALVKVRRRRR